MTEKQKQVKAAYMRLYRLRKKEPTKGSIRIHKKALKTAEKQFKTIKKTAHLTEVDLLRRKADSARKKADYYKKKLTESDSRKDQFKYFRKVIKANSEKDELLKKLGREKKKGKTVKRKKGIINERYSIWEAKDHLHKVMKGEVKYKLYKGKKFASQINNLNNELSRLSLTANSNDIVVISVNPVTDDIIDIFIKK